ncbi:MAG: hypothetical protein HC883_01155 [Bdellovibrionaceae bacterium]|nr:hypothetical protein [Pseudobdellovibrionaceae bacterium]
MNLIFSVLAAVSFPLFCESASARLAQPTDEMKEASVVALVNEAEARFGGVGLSAEQRAFLYRSLARAKHNPDVRRNLSTRIATSDPLTAPLPAPGNFVCINLGASANLIGGVHFKGGFCTNFLQGHWVSYETAGTGMGIEAAADVFYMRSSARENPEDPTPGIGYTAAAIVGAEYTECEVLTPPAEIFCICLV